MINRKLIISCFLGTVFVYGNTGIAILDVQEEPLYTGNLDMAEIEQFLLKPRKFPIKIPPLQIISHESRKPLKGKRYLKRRSYIKPIEPFSSEQSQSLISIPPLKGIKSKQYKPLEHLKEEPSLNGGNLDLTETEQSQSLISIPPLKGIKSKQYKPLEHLKEESLNAVDLDLTETEQSQSPIKIPSLKIIKSTEHKPLELLKGEPSINKSFTKESDVSNIPLIEEPGVMSSVITDIQNIIKKCPIENVKKSWEGYKGIPDNIKECKEGANLIDKVFKARINFVQEFFLKIDKVINKYPIKSTLPIQQEEPIFKELVSCFEELIKNLSGGDLLGYLIETLFLPSESAKTIMDFIESLRQIVRGTVKIQHYKNIFDLARKISVMIHGFLTPDSLFEICIRAQQVDYNTHLATLTTASQIVNLFLVIQSAFLEKLIKLMAPPKVAVAPPKVPVANPKVAVVNPKVAVVNPKVAVANPKVAVANPKVAVAPPKVAVAPPKVPVANPKVGVANPKVAVANPKVRAVTQNPKTQK